MKAYNYVREKFNNALPHPDTISKWYRSVDGSPGFTEEAQVLLKAKVEEYAQLGQKVLCNLIMDETAIMRRVEWTGEKFTGFVDIGTNITGDTLPEAKDALVFMLVAVNGHWKVPVGYFLIDGLNGTEKANLVNKLLCFIHETGVIITSITFDGAASNFSMARSLGADFEDFLNLVTSFPHPLTSDPIWIFLDPCHMFKLWRNVLAALKVLEDVHGRTIKWEYFEKLVELQDQEGLHAATKIRKRHVNWKNEKQKVKIAAQTFSNSVADAFLFLENDLKLDDFQNAEATADFCKVANNLFDIFNTRSKFSKSPYRKAICPENFQTILTYLEYCKNYIISLNVNGLSVLLTRRKTGFLGFLICIKSLKGMYNTYVASETPLLKYILTYKLSQDHLEIFFSAIRSHAGSNNNPTARQFEAIYKRLLVHTEIKGSEYGNALAMDSTTILSVTSVTKSNTGENLEDSDDYLQLVETCRDHDYLNSPSWHLTLFAKDIVAYIAGFVVKCVQKCIICEECLTLLESDETFSQLQKRKQFGHMINAAEVVINICKTGETYLRFFHSERNIFKKRNNKITDYLIRDTIRNLPPSVFEHFKGHTLDNDPLHDHPLQLIKLILKNYFKIRIHHETFKLKDNITNRVRSLLTKKILFSNQ